VDALIPGIDPESIGDWKILYRISASDNSILYYGNRGRAGIEEAAIKVIGQFDASDSSTLERLKAEVDALEKLNNPHIAKLIAKDLDAKPAWVATEYLGRKNLETLLMQTQTPIKGTYWWELARSIFSGLADMHSIDIIHRDIKPANIMVDGPTIKIIDFGISYVPGHTSARKNNSLEFEGSRLFAAPENYGTRFTPTMDVFSAAVTLAYAARLKSIWNDENEDTLSKSIQKGSPDLSGLTPEQVEFITPLLDKYALQRPTSEEALNKVLEYIEFIANQESPKPIPLRGSSYFYRLIRKRSFQFASVLVLLTTLITSVLVRDSKIIYIQADENTIDSTRNTEVASNPSEKPKSTSIECENAYLNNSSDILEKCLSPANAGDERSIYYMGRIEKQKGRIENAESWFLKNAKNNDAYSMSQLVQIYIDTNQTDKYKVWVKRCADHPSKIEEIAKCKLFYGMDLEKNSETVKKAVLYLKDAYDFGNSDAAVILGYIYERINDKDNQLLWWTRAAEKSNETGIYNLIVLAQQLGKKETELKWLKISANNGNARHAWMYAMEFILNKDFENAKKYSLISANKGYAQGMGVYGSLLWVVDKNIKSAKVWLKKGADLKDIGSINNLGNIARLEDKNYVEALSWYQESKSLGDLQGALMVGVTYADHFNDSKSACNAFKDVIKLADNKKLLDKYEDSMDEWVNKSAKAIPIVCV
jgi:serine/threonine protein kinase